VAQVQYFAAALQFALLSSPFRCARTRYANSVTLTFMAKAPSVKWTREHFLIALNLYCKLPFGRFDRNNRLVIEVASKMGAHLAVWR
jgi:hypothetical protein